jgi:tight adherence protein B
MNYSEYKRTKKQWRELVLIWSAFCVVFGLLFYKHVLGIIFMFPFIYFFEKYDRKKQITKRKVLLGEQFLEALHVMSASLDAGNSLEAAVKNCANGLSTLFPPDAFIIKEFDAMKRGLACNMNVEDLFMDLGKRSGVAEINEFAEVCMVSKRSGGNIVKVMAHTVKVMDARKSMEREVRAITSEKRIEGHIMDILLPGLLLYIDVTMPDMMSYMYTGIIGRGMMTIILVLYFMCFLMMEKITNVKV